MTSSISDKRLKSSQSTLFDQMLKKGVPSSAAAARGTSKPKGSKKQRQKPSQTQTSSRQSGSGGSRPAKKKSSAKPKGGQDFQKGNKPSGST